MGITPLATILARVSANWGNTSPGQSHTRRSFSMMSVWKCFVLPGVADTTVFFSPSSALMVELLPTLG